MKFDITIFNFFFGREGGGEGGVFEVGHSAAIKIISYRTLDGHKAWLINMMHWQTCLLLIPLFRSGDLKSPPPPAHH